MAKRGTPWTDREMMVLFTNRPNIDKIARLLTRTRPAISRQLWELKRLEEHHPFAEHCDCACYKKNNYHCEGKDSQEHKFLEAERAGNDKQGNLF